MPKHARNARNDRRKATESKITIEDPYMKGFSAAKSEGMSELADVLRIRVAQPLPSGERLSEPMAREIFTAMFGVFETDQEFGQDPAATDDDDAPDFDHAVDTGTIRAIMDGVREPVG